jgi:hypothetical protein
MTRVVGWVLLMLFTGLATAWFARLGRPHASCGRLARDDFGAVRRRDLAVFDLVAARIRRSLPLRAAAVAVMIGR